MAENSTTPPDFTEQARQLVNEFLVDADTAELTKRIASFAAEAATQGQATLFAQVIEAVDRYNPVAEGYGDSTIEASGSRARREIITLIKSLSPDPNLLDRVRNEALKQAAQVADRLCATYSRYAGEAADDPETRHNEMAWAFKAVTAEKISSEIRLLIAAIGDDKEERQ